MNISIDIETLAIKTRVALAEDKAVSAELLRTLSYGTSPIVRGYVAANPNVTLDILRHLVCDRFDTVAKAANKALKKYEPQNSGKKHNVFAR